jgi:hypothetical protein
MTIKLSNYATSIEIKLSDDACMHEVANALRAACYAVGYHIDSITEAIPPVEE